MAKKRKKKVRKSAFDNAPFALLLAILAVALFVFFALSPADNQGSAAHASENAEKIVGLLTSTDSDVMLLDDHITALAVMDYQELKDEFGVDSDFSIYVEDADGNIVPIGDKPCLGSSRASINGIPCG